MDAQQTRATLTVALMAAFADGLKDEREREAVKQVADALGGEAGIDLPTLFRDVLLSKPDLAQVVAPLDTPDLKQYAYEMAVGVAAADGAQNEAEKQFLEKLAAALGLPAANATETSARAAGIAAAAVDASPSTPAQGTVLGTAGLTQAEYDKMILDASIMNAALELLPESLASMAIIPLQLRLVYRIGKSYGYPMDMSQAKDFVATVGVGLTGQYVEQLGRKLLGGLLGGLAGGLGRAVGRQAASSGMSFATTYALGRVAQRYYASGRTLDTAMLKDTFTSLLAEARGLTPQYRRQIEQQAASIDTRSLASLVRQG
jgi:uncharacterized protein (DUF697 family)/uncharacterized tellurite resistance protein B-like protein